MQDNSGTHIQDIAEGRHVEARHVCQIGCSCVAVHSCLVLRVEKTRLGVKINRLDDDRGMKYKFAKPQQLKD